MCSQSECYKSARAAPELTYRPLKRLIYLFGLPLAKACCEMSRRDGAIVAWHEVPLEFGHFEDGLQGAERSFARAIGEEGSKKSRRLSVRLSNLVTWCNDAPSERWEAGA